MSELHGGPRHDQNAAAWSSAGPIYSPIVNGGVASAFVAANCARRGGDPAVSAIGRYRTDQPKSPIRRIKRRHHQMAANTRPSAHSRLSRMCGGAMAEPIAPFGWSHQHHSWGAQYPSAPEVPAALIESATSPLSLTSAKRSSAQGHTNLCTRFHRKDST